MNTVKIRLEPVVHLYKKRKEVEGRLTVEPVTTKPAVFLEEINHPIGPLKINLPPLPPSISPPPQSTPSTNALPPLQPSAVTPQTHAGAKA